MASGFLIGEEELFLPYTEFPWFKKAPVSKICTVEHYHSEHLYWPLLNIDLSIKSVRHPKEKHTNTDAISPKVPDNSHQPVQQSPVFCLH